MAEGNDKSIRIPQDGGEVLGGPDGKNHLLVIAIDEYAHCPLLNNCVKDARDFIDVLTSKYQFHPENITTLFDAEATRPKILAGLNQLKQKVQPEDNLVIYFSGHGETEDDVGYWVPVGANPDNNWEFISTYDIKSLQSRSRFPGLILLIQQPFIFQTSGAKIQQKPYLQVIGFQVIERLGEMHVFQTNNGFDHYSKRRVNFPIKRKTIDS